MQENEIINAPIVIDTQEVEVVDVEVTGAFPSSAISSAFNHALLTNREISDAHPISAITGLREELDSIEALQTVYSDKRNNADYYEWADGNNTADNRTGLFVSLDNGGKISVCAGDNIFGVIVDGAAFVGGQDNNKRGNSYGLVATTGEVLVRCTINVAKGDYVISNIYGVATKADVNYGYKVVDIHYLGDAPYATINLTISGDKIHKIGSELQDLDYRMDNAEFNIASAVNVANAAYKKAGEVVVISQELSDKVNNAVDTVDKVVAEVGNLSDQVIKAEQISAQANAIVNSAVNSAISIRNEAITKANEAVSGTAQLRDELGAMEKQITDIEDQVTIVTQRVNGDYQTVDTIGGVDKQKNIVYYAKDTKKYHYYDYNYGDWREATNPKDAGLAVAIAGIRVQTDETSASINDLVEWQDAAINTMARIERKADANGAYIQSTVANINTYTVGPYSQAYGFTLQQAKDTFDVGMVYVPTVSKTGDNAEKYTDYVQEFNRGTYYVWNGEEWMPSGDVIMSGSYSIGSNNTPYWYVDTDEDVLFEGETYVSHNLYKWDAYLDTAGEETKYQWVQVANLSSNSLSRAISYVRQSANSIESTVAGLSGEYAGTKQTVEEDHAKISSIASWPTGEGQHNMAILEQKSDENGAYMVLAAVKNVDDNPVIEEIGGAKIVLSDSNTTGSYIKMDADNINFGTGTYTIDANHINLNGAVTANNNVVIDTDGKITAVNADITGKITATSGSFNNCTIGGWKINNDGILSGGYNESLNNDQTISGMLSALTTPSYTVNGVTKKVDIFAPSLLNGRNTPIRFLAGSTPMIIDGTYDDISKTYDIALDNATFMVLEDGSLYASAAKIEGNIIARTGYIGGWEINSTSLVNYSGEKDANGYYPHSFCMQTAGDGAVNALAIGKANESTWGQAAFRVGVDGTLYASSAHITGGSFSIHTKDNNIDEYMSVNDTSCGVLVMCRNFDLNDYYNLGHPTYPLIQILGCGIYFGYTTDFRGEDITHTNYMLYRGNNVYLIGDWTTDVAMPTASDASVKHDIEDLDSRYDVLFDNINPRRFKYNDGTSDRYHSGYITQEIQNALQIANISEKEFAAICTFASGTDDEYSSLRYDEFVSLNTWQIQKAKARISTLEETIAKLEDRISELENK